MQYPQRSAHNLVTGMNTLGEKVIRSPKAKSRRSAARSSNSAVESRPNSANSSVDNIMLDTTGTTCRLGGTIVPGLVAYFTDSALKVGQQIFEARAERIDALGFELCPYRTKVYRFTDALPTITRPFDIGVDRSASSSRRGRTWWRR